jgi:hypothetical protein
MEREALKVTMELGLHGRAKAAYFRHLQKTADRSARAEESGAGELDASRSRVAASKSGTAFEQGEEKQ